MKCSKCGFRARTLPSMARHYRKKHPASMKRTRHLQPKVRTLKRTNTANKFCPHCGGFLG